MMNEYNLAILSLIVAGWMMVLPGIGFYKKKKSGKTKP